MSRLLAPFLMLIAGVIFILVYVLVDNAITCKRVEENQIEWDKFSEGMTTEEKRDCFLDWLYMRKAEKGWNYLYPPCMYGNRKEKNNEL